MSTATLPAPRTSDGGLAAEARRVFADCLAAAERGSFRVEDLIGGERSLDFGRPFMPEEFVGAGRLPFLDARGRLLLSQIRGYVYLRMFVNIEAFVMPFVLDEVLRDATSDDLRTRALVQFAAEEAKHTDMLNRFSRAFERDFGTPCEVIGPPEAIAAAVREHHPLGVGLIVLGGEWVTLAHHTGAVRGDPGLDPVFKGMLEAHWSEESRHARMDSVLVRAHAQRLPPEEVVDGIRAWQALCEFFDAGLADQARFDLDSLERALGRPFDDAQRATFLREQLAVLRWTFLGSAMVQRPFVAVLEAISPGATALADEAARRYR